MKQDAFLAVFEPLINAQEGVDRLRRVILDLALRGKLLDVPANIETVQSDLLEFKRLLSDLVSAGIVPARHRWAPIARGETPYDIPEHWTWARLGQLAYPQPGFAFPSSRFNIVGRGMPLIRIRDIGSLVTECSFEGDYRSEFIVKKGDFLVGMDGNFNARKWQGGDALLNQRVSRLMFFSDGTSQHYVVWALQQHLDRIWGTKRYTTVQHLSGSQIAEALIPFPPVDEQIAIESRVIELMSLCDELEREQEAAEELRVATARSGFNALVGADPSDTETPELVLGELFEQVLQPGGNALSAVDELTKAILDLAVGGRLVVTSGETPGDGPLRSWRHVVLGDVLSKIEAGWSAPCETTPPPVGEWGVLKVSAVTSGIFRACESKRLRRHVVPRPQLSVRAGDVIFARASSPELVGMTAVAPADEPFLMLSDKHLRLTFDAALLPAYFHLWSMSPRTRNRMREIAGGTSHSMQNISQQRLLALEMALPPVTEQMRIIEVVSELLRLCSELSAEFASERRLSEVLRDSVAVAFLA